MVLGKLPVPGRPTFLIVGQGPIALAVGAGGGCLDIFTLLCAFTSLSPSLWETIRYRLKYCLKGPLNHKQPTTNQYKKEHYPKLSQICSYGIFSKGLKSEFETAVVNEKSGFEPLKFYCSLMHCQKF